MPKKSRFLLAIFSLACFLGIIGNIANQCLLSPQFRSTSGVVVENRKVVIPTGETVWFVFDNEQMVSITNEGGGHVTFDDGAVNFTVIACSVSCSRSLPVYDFILWTNLHEVFVNIPDKAQVNR